MTYTIYDPCLMIYYLVFKAIPTNLLRETLNHPIDMAMPFHKFTPPIPKLFDSKFGIVSDEWAIGFS